MNLRHFDFFIQVAESQSITEAAKRLHISQPAVSMQIKRLEQELGVFLLTPHARGFLLTDAGKVFLDYAKRMVSLQEQMTRSLEEFRKGKRGHIIIGASPLIGTYVLPSYIATFLQKYNGIQIDLRLYPEEQVEKLVRDGKIDIGVSFISPSDPFSLRITKFYTHYVVPIQPTHPFPKDVCLVPKDIPQIPISTSYIECETTEYAKQSILAGLGWGICLKSAVKHELQTGLLTIRSSPHFSLQLPLHLITRPAEKLAKSLWIVLNYLSEKSF
jgi:DNA-binding transcriptional LysR family regulator